MWAPRCCEVRACDCVGKITRGQAWSLYLRYPYFYRRMGPPQPLLPCRFFWLAHRPSLQRTCHFTFGLPEFSLVSVSIQSVCLSVPDPAFAFAFAFLPSHAFPVCLCLRLRRLHRPRRACLPGYPSHFVCHLPSRTRVYQSNARRAGK